MKIDDDSVQMMSCSIGTTEQKVGFINQAYINKKNEKNTGLVVYF